MGVLRPFCIATEGVRAYAISYAFDDNLDEGSPFQSSFRSPQYAVIVQSNPYPNFVAARPEGLNLEQETIQNVLGWKVIHVVHRDKDGDSWFKDRYTDGGTRTYNCGVTRQQNSVIKDSYVFTLHVTDILSTVNPALNANSRKLSTFTFRPGQRMEVREDERPAAVAEGSTASRNATLAGSGVPRSVLYPLNKEKGGNGPWVEAMATSLPLSVQISTANHESRAFPALAQDVRALTYRPLAVGFGDQKLHIVGRSGNCTQLTTVPTRVDGNAMVLAQEPTATGISWQACFEDKGMEGMIVQIGVYDEDVFVLFAKPVSQMFRDDTVTFDIFQSNAEKANNETKIQSKPVISSPFFKMGSAGWDFQALLPMPSQSTQPPTSSSSSVSDGVVSSGHISFITGSMETLVILSPQSAQSGIYHATPFNITVQEPYKYFPYRDPELLSKAEIGWIAAGSCLALIFLGLGVWWYRRKRQGMRKAMLGIELKESYLADAKPWRAMGSAKEEEEGGDQNLNSMDKTEEELNRDGRHGSTTSVDPFVGGGEGRVDGLEDLKFSKHPRPQVAIVMDGK